MTVVLLPIVAKVGIDGVLVVGLLAGIILIALSILGMGRYMRYVPLPVIEGFTLGIAIIIGLQQIPAALGVQVSGTKVLPMAIAAVQKWLAAPVLAPVLITIAVAGAMLLFARWRPGLPVSLAAVALVSFTAVMAGLPVPMIGVIPSGLPRPELPTASLSQWSSLVVPAIAVAALAALESLLSATVADGMTVSEHHDPNRELFGQGIANMVTPLFGGVPATAAIARTAVNVRSGARSRLGAITQSVVLLVVILFASHLVSYIPLSALAGVLLATVVTMVDRSRIAAIFNATRSDAVVLVVTAVATVAFDLVTAVVAGLIVAGVLALRQVARSAEIEQVAWDSSDHSDQELELLREHVIAYRLDGPLFFAAAHDFLLGVTQVRDCKVVILRLSRVKTLDATGAAVLADTVKGLEDRGVTVLLSGIRDEHDPIFAKLGVYGGLAARQHIFATTPEAIAHAHQHIAAGGSNPQEACV
jgi:SulP family sulfate permease